MPSIQSQMPGILATAPEVGLGLLLHCKYTSKRCHVAMYSNQNERGSE